MTKEEAIKYLQQLYPNGGHCWLDEQRIEAIGMAVKSLQEEPVSEELEGACEQLTENARKHKVETSSPFFSQTDYKQGVIDGANWQKKQTIRKSCEWLRENIYQRVYKEGDSLGFPTAVFLEDFRKAMEE